MYQNEELGLQHGDYMIVPGRRRWSYMSAPYRYRCGPVEGIRKHRGGYGHCHRHFRHIRSKKIHEDHVEQGFNFRYKCPPDPWDDYPVNRYKNWKAYRKTQYKSR